MRTGRIYIQYDDGDEQWVHLNKVCYLQLTGTATTDQRPDNPKISDLHIGSRVSVWWQTEERFYSGTVKRVKDLSLPNAHRVFYDDGDQSCLSPVSVSWNGRYKVQSRAIETA